MKQLVRVAITLLIFFFTNVALAAGEISCACDEPACGPCTEDTGTDFYTAKCGPGLTKLKSCKRRQCTPVHSQDMCFAKLNGTAPVAANRSIASVANSKAKRSADVILAVGRAEVERTDINHQKLREDLSKGMTVVAGDRIITKEDGRVRLRFPELSEVFISPGSDLTITEALVEERAGPAKRTILLDLVRGRVRSRVQGRYDDGESKFEVKTPAAVAGVRGTDFTVSFDPGVPWKTEVNTLGGAVSLDGRGPAGTLLESQHALVVTATTATYIVPTPVEGASQFEIEAALSRGYMSPVFTLTPEQTEKIDRDNSEASIVDNEFRSGSDTARRFAANGRTPADAGLCKAPLGGFNQCSWTCEGNPKGAKKCRSDLKGVSCVRKLCQANGLWSDRTVLPPQQGVNCEASKPVVGDCGTY